MKTCYKCEKPKDLNKFKKDKTCRDGRANICKKCHSLETYAQRRADPVAVSKQYARTQKWQDANPEFKMFQAAKRRAKQANLPFEITREDIKIPKFCPVLGIPIVVGGQRYASANSPSLDRFKPELGYVSNNVAVISHKANTMKSDATITDLRLLLNWMERQQVGL
jgi:hypothetical protein